MIVSCSTTSNDYQSIEKLDAVESEVLSLMKKNKLTETNTLMFFDTENKKGRIFITNTGSKKENGHEVMSGIWNLLDKYKK
jgi:S-adenosylmethionine synthetase